ncbi:hypothetical protein [Paracoccus solventivorans]|uniref:hypothetical protein n=1 Tax=Paracoccus solventivorans TaxID=53463 RepID=UPI0009329D15|nr:hypothetical protein [Paracoccus solventivorans]
MVRFLRDLVALDRGAIVIDLIYGLPGQTPQNVADDVRLCATLGLDGLDLYLLNLIRHVAADGVQLKGKPVAGHRRRRRRRLRASQALLGGDALVGLMWTAPPQLSAGDALARHPALPLRCPR